MYSSYNANGLVVERMMLLESRREREKILLSKESRDEGDREEVKTFKKNVVAG